MLVFHDVDGCLNHVSGEPIGFTEAELGDQLRQALTALGRQLDASEVSEFVLNTGRSRIAGEYLVRAIGSRKARYVLAEHGATLWDVELQRSLDVSALAHRIGEPHVLKSHAAMDDLLVWYDQEGEERLRRAIGCEVRLDRQFDQAASLSLRVPAGADGDHMVAIMQRLIEGWGLDAATFDYHHSRPEGFVDVLGKCDKGFGVRAVVSHLEADQAPTVAVGNGLNDLPMLAAVELPMCPSNAENEVRNYCATHGRVLPDAFIGAVQGWLSEDLA